MMHIITVNFVEMILVNILESIIRSVKKTGFFGQIDYFDLTYLKHTYLHAYNNFPIYTAAVNISIVGGEWDCLVFSAS